MTVKDRFLRIVSVIAAKADVQIMYLKRNVQMPLIELLLEYGEEELIIEQRDGVVPELFSEYELKKIQKFNEIMKNLPIESDIFWSYQSINSQEWDNLRLAAANLLKDLGHNSK